MHETLIMIGIHGQNLCDFFIRTFFVFLFRTVCFFFFFKQNKIKPTTADPSTPPFRRSPKPLKKGGVTKRIPALRAKKLTLKLKPQAQPAGAAYSGSPLPTPPPTPPQPLPSPPPIPPLPRDYAEFELSLHSLLIRTLTRRPGKVLNRKTHAFARAQGRIAPPKVRPSPSVLFLPSSSTARRSHA